MVKEIKGTRDRLSSSWFFRLSSLAFIVNTTPLLAVSGRGLIAFFSILYLAVLAGFIEKSIGRVIHLFIQGVSRNKLFFIFMIWYAVGYALSSFYFDGLDQWKLIMGPLVILIAIGYMFVFMNNDKCYRAFQIAFILASGVQAVLSIFILYSTPDIARLAYSQTSGAWIFGNPIYFSICSIIIPLLIWRSLKESGIKRILLFLSCLLIIIESVLSSFATPLGLLILAIVIIGLLSAFSFIRGRSRKWSILIIGTLILVVIIGNQSVAENELFSSSYSRIVNFINDPKSGGYTGVYATTVSRWVLAQVSINSFVDNPLFGAGGSANANHNSKMGGHSSFLDSLAIYGLFGGGGALCGMILIMLVKTGARFRRDRSWESLLSLTVVLLLVAVGVMDAYWVGALPIVLIVARPFSKSP